MKIDLSRLKLRPRESETFYLEDRGQDEILEGFGGKFLNPVQVELEVTNTERLYVGHGKLKTLLNLPCSRCLEEFNYPIDIDLDLAMLPADKAHDFSQDEDFIFFDGDEVDISSSVNEHIFMAIPIIPLCKEDCQGLCSNCGIDKNTGNCSCAEQDIDPRWEKLKNL